MVMTEARSGQIAQKLFTYFNQLGWTEARKMMPDLMNPKNLGRFLTPTCAKIVKEIGVSEEEFREFLVLRGYKLAKDIGL